MGSRRKISRERKRRRRKKKVRDGGRPENTGPNAKLLITRRSRTTKKIKTK